ncbi:transposable element Tc1 transposase [Trichonephila clavipes]|nr:transposable element Tc1 transposase [Trichonephila clavipes]
MNFSEQWAMTGHVKRPSGPQVVHRCPKVCLTDFKHYALKSGMSVRRSLLRLTLTGNFRRLRHQWCDERRKWRTEWNDIVFTDESRFCMQHHGGWI